MTDPSTAPDPKAPVTGADVLAAGLDDWRLLMRRNRYSARPWLRSSSRRC